MTTPLAMSAKLALAGWNATQHDDTRAKNWNMKIAVFRAPTGQAHTVHPAAIKIWATYGGLTVEQEGGGEEFALPSFTVDPMEAIHTTGFCTAFAARLGHAVTPIGSLDNGAAFLMADATGRVFHVDHTGEYFLGEDFNAALNTLTSGGPRPRVLQDGTW
jgi:hypothetical protein